MIQVNEFRISLDKKCLIVDVLIENLDYFENIYLDSIYIDTQKTFKPTGPSLESVIELIDCKEDGELTMKHYRGYIPIDSIADNMFFMWILAEGELKEGTPCGCGFKDNLILSVTYDKYPLYLQGMKLLREMNDCTPADNLIDYIFNNKALELSLNTGNYETAISYWELLFGKKEKTLKRRCGCHG